MEVAQWCKEHTLDELVVEWVYRRHGRFEYSLRTHEVERGPDESPRPSWVWFGENISKSGDKKFDSVGKLVVIKPVGWG